MEQTMLKIKVTNNNGMMAYLTSIAVTFGKPFIVLPPSQTKDKDDADTIIILETKEIFLQDIVTSPDFMDINCNTRDRIFAFVHKEGVEVKGNISLSLSYVIKETIL